MTAKWIPRLEFNTFLSPFPRTRTYTLPGRVGISSQRAGLNLASRGQAPSTALPFADNVREALKNKNTEWRPSQQLRNRADLSFRIADPWAYPRHMEWIFSSLLPTSLRITPRSDQETPLR